MSDVSVLKAKYPWPTEKPDIQFDEHGWFGECNEKMLSRFINEDTRIVLELGSWLGKSTRFIARKAKHATVLTVDHWLGTTQISNDAPDTNVKLPTLYETFLSNCWNFKSRIVPMRTNTLDAIDELVAAGINPNVVYLDAAHDYDSVRAELGKCIAHFPDATFIGDDFSPKWDGVMRAVWEHAEDNGYAVSFYSHAWAISGRWRELDKEKS